MSETHLFHDYVSEQDRLQREREKKEKKKAKLNMPKKDKSIKIPPLYEFQLYDSF